LELELELELVILGVGVMGVVVEAMVSRLDRCLGNCAVGL
jgi:hypothetical protein